MGQRLSKRELKKLGKNVNMTDDEIRGWHKEYRKSCGKGKKELTVKEFKDVYNRMFKGDASQFAERVFRTFDTDGSGTVDFTEFLVGLKMTSSENPEEKIGWAFDMYDIDKSGTISKDELIKIIKSVYSMAGCTDLPDDMQTAEMTAEGIFNKLDTDGDGEITREEFKIGALEDPLVIRLLQIDPDT